MGYGLIPGGECKMKTHTLMKFVWDLVVEEEERCIFFGSGAGDITLNV